MLKFYKRKSSSSTSQQPAKAVASIVTPRTEPTIEPTTTTERTSIPTAIPTTTTTKAKKKKAFKTRTSPSGLYNLVRDLSAAQKEAVKAIGFGSLLSLGISKCPMELSRQLVLNFDARRSCLILYNGEMVSIDEDDVHCVLNLPRGRLQISESHGRTSDGPEYLEMLRAWRTRWVGNPSTGSPSVVSMPARIKANTDADDDFKRDFVVYVVSSFLWTTQNSQARFKVLKSLMDVDKIKDLNWCKFTMDGLINSVEKWQGNPSSYFYGPIAFLLLCYMDRVVEYSVRRTYNRIFPILSCVDDKMVYERKDAEEKRHSYLRGRVIDRISLPASLPAHAWVDRAGNERTPREVECNVEQVSADAETPHEVHTSSVVAASLELSRAVQRVSDAAQGLSNVFEDAEAPDVFPFESGIQSLAETMELLKALHARTQYPAASAPASAPASPPASPPAFQQGMSLTEQSEFAQSEPEEGVFPDESASSPTEQPNPVQKPVLGKRSIRGRRTAFTVPCTTVTEATEATDSEAPVPLSMEMPELRPVRKLKKLPAVLRSPYLAEIRTELPTLRPMDNAMAGVVFADGLDVNELLYSSANTSLSRNALRSMQKGEWLNSGILDAWAHELNSESQQLSTGSRRRIFFSTMHSACLEGEAEMYNAVLLEECRTFGISIEDIQNAELIFLPIGWAEHYYLGVFNRTTLNLEIIDNRPLPKGISFKAKYDVVPIVSKMFLGFLESLNKDLSRELKKFKPKLVKVPWADNSNSSDCGVYCMRHMERYMGKAKNWDCGLTIANASRKLHTLRIQYLARILLSDNNNQKSMIKYLQSRASGLNVILN